VGKYKDSIKNEMKNKQTKNTGINTDAVYANTHHMTTLAAAKRCYTDTQVTVNPTESTEMDSRENIIQHYTKNLPMCDR
jgi:hypothetical protein